MSSKSCVSTLFCAHLGSGPLLYLDLLLHYVEKFRLPSLTHLVLRSTPQAGVPTLLGVPTALPPPFFLPFFLFGATTIGFLPPAHPPTPSPLTLNFVPQVMQPSSARTSRLWSQKILKQMLHTNPVLMTFL